MKLIYRIVAALALLASFAMAQPKPKSKAEYDALMAIQNATDADARMAAIDNLLTKFADTEFKSQVLLMAAATAQQKNDYEKMTVYAERTIEADPQNFQAMLMLAAGIAQHTREFDLDREEKLAKATKYAEQAMATIPNAPKPAQFTDEQWAGVKKDSTADAHAALGQCAVVRKKYDVAVQEYKTAVDSAATPEPANIVRLANAYNLNKQPDAAIATLDRLKTMTDVSAAITAAATNERNTAIKLKGAASGTTGGTTGSPAAAPASTTPSTPAPAAAPVKP
jgi:tetratricopeptide (TPR) repeat protein